MHPIGLCLKKEYIRFLKLKRNRKFKKSFTATCFFAVLTVICFLLSLFAEMPLARLLPFLKINKKLPSKNRIAENWLLNENAFKTSLLAELNFSKVFYTPM